MPRARRAGVCCRGAALIPSDWKRGPRIVRGAWQPVCGLHLRGFVLASTRPPVRLGFLQTAPCRPGRAAPRWDNALLSQPFPGQPRSSSAVCPVACPLACPQAALPRMPTHWGKHREWARSEVPRLAVLPGSSRSNPLFHFTGLSFWHSEKHHLKLIKAPYFVPNLTTTSSVYYVLCRVGGSSQQGVPGCATKTQGWGDICRVNRMWAAFPQITVFCTDYGIPLVESPHYAARRGKISGNSFLRRFIILFLLLRTTL